MADGNDYHNINPLGYVPALQVVEGAIVLSRAHNDPMKINQAVARFAQQLQCLPRRKSGSVLQAAKKR